MDTHHTEMHPHRAMFANRIHHAGVGKTVQAIALASCYMHEWSPLLVICPASLRLLWCEELEKWLPGLRPCDITVVQGSADWHPEAMEAVCTASQTQSTQPHRTDCVSGTQNCSFSAVASAADQGAAASPKPSQTVPKDGSQQHLQAAQEDHDDEYQPPGKRWPKVIIISYHMAANLSCTACKFPSTGDNHKQSPAKGSKGAGATQCTGFPHCVAAGVFPFVIVDESHHMRTQSGPTDNQMTEVAKKIVRMSRRAVLLSGTPSVTRPFDLAGQLYSLQPELMGAAGGFARFKSSFAFRYCQRCLVKSRRCAPSGTFLVHLDTLMCGMHVSVYDSPAQVRGLRQTFHSAWLCRVLWWESRYA
jgi:hypothetical protein